MADEAAVPKGGSGRGVLFQLAQIVPRLVNGISERKESGFERVSNAYSHMAN
jgi:hypothetical protein